MEIDAPREPATKLEGKTSKELDEKTAWPVVNSTNDSDAASIEHGHLQELEVDLDLVMQEQGEEDYAADHSPFPEGTSHCSPQVKSVFTEMTSSGCYPRCRRPSNTRQHSPNVDSRHCVYNGWLRCQSVFLHEISFSHDCLSSRRSTGISPWRCLGKDSSAVYSEPRNAWQMVHKSGSTLQYQGALRHCNHEQRLLWVSILSSRPRKMHL